MRAERHHGYRTSVVARCFVTRELPGRALDRLRAEHEVDVWEERVPPSREELRSRLDSAAGLLCLLTDPVDRELIEACPRLRAISNYAVGTDNVDLEAARERGIEVGVTPDVLTEATADMTFALMLAAARRVVEADAEVRAGEWLTWEPARLLGRDVQEATLGIIGFGRIGRAVARRAAGFDMEVLHTSGSGGAELPELLEASDFVSIHCPLTPDTRGMIGERELRAMKPTSVLVNTARGPIVDADALVRALRGGWIGAAALDVTDPEPLSADHPLLGAPNLTVAPHIASATHAARERMADLAVDNLLAGLAGRPLPAAAS
jgi:lactate dehydrogenase-like 2-hydroxyacid dehydrogenase